MTLKKWQGRRVIKSENDEEEERRTELHQQELLEKF